MQLKIYSGFSELPHSFDGLFSQGETTSIFYSRQWFELLAKTCMSAGEVLRIYGVLDESGRALACLPCYHISGEKALHGLENFYSSLFTLFCEDDKALALITKQLAIEKWHSITLKPLAHDDDFAKIQQSLENSGLRTQGFFCFGNWYMRLEARKFEEYYNSLSSKLKNTIKRRHKKLDKETENEIVLTQGQENLDKYIKDFVSIYNRSWKEPEPFPDFIPNFIRLCQQRNWLRMGLLYVDGQPAAAQLWTVHHGIAYIYKLAYDETFSKYSTGSVLTKQLMEYVIDGDGVEEIDYLTGDDNYKKDWMSHRRERWGVVAYNPRTIKGLLGALKNIGGHRLKQLIRPA